MGQMAIKYLIQAIIVGFLAFSSLVQAEDISAQVKRIVDGDTFDVIITQGKTPKRDTVRLIGIDTPESRVNTKAQKDSKRSGQDLKAILENGKKSAEFLSNLLPVGTTVRLEFDVEHRDRYGRYLAYAYLPDNRMINEILVSSGYASLLTIPPNVKYAKKFSGALQNAQRSKLGLWKQPPG